MNALRPISPTRFSVDTSGAGNNVFVYGLLGMFMCSFLLPVAWIKGNEYIRTCRALGVEPSGLGVTGRVLGIVGTVLHGLALVAFIALQAIRV